jgi:FAD binding domain-containing protein/aromatic ring hydroxylase-like protein
MRPGRSPTTGVVVFCLLATRRTFICPSGGQGLNLGIQDATNLGWKLAAHVQGRAPDGLLDSYHAERHPVAARVLATTRAQGLLMNPPPDADDVWALRDIVIDLAQLPDANRYLAGLMSGLDLRYDLGDPDPLVGTRMVDLSLRTEEGCTTVNTLLRSGRGLILELGGHPSPRTPVPYSVERVVARAIDSPVGTALGASPGVDRLLIRPDGHVCWAGAGPDSSPESALLRWLPWLANVGRTTNVRMSTYSCIYGYRQPMVDSWIGRRYDLMT